MIRYQCQLDNRGLYPIRDTWEEAAQDTVNSGHSVWDWNGRGIRGDLIRSQSKESMNTKLVREDENWYYYDHYDSNGMKFNSSMKMKGALWFSQQPQIILSLCNIKISKEKAEALENLFDGSLDCFDYVWYAGLDGYGEEAVKWILGPIAEVMKYRKISLLQAFSSVALRYFIKYLSENRFPKHYAKQIFDILLVQNWHYVIPSAVESFLDDLIKEPRFTAIDNNKVDPAVLEVLQANSDKVQEVKTNLKLIQWFVGQVLRTNKGMSPTDVKESIKRQIKILHGIDN